MTDRRRGEKAVDGLVLSGTPTPVLSGTLFPTYRERSHRLNIGYDGANSALSNLANIESFGLLLTRPVVAQDCGRAAHGASVAFPSLQADRHATNNYSSASRRAGIPLHPGILSATPFPQIVEQTAESATDALTPNGFVATSVATNPAPYTPPSNRHQTSHAHPRSAS
ncbi:MAG: hypothetical protein ACJAVZ_001784 [Afipia broomeae]|jgi:hypothetical protein